MASDEFISLEAPCEVDAKDEGGDIQVKAPDVNGAEPLASELQPEGESGVVGSNPKPSAGNLDLEEGQVEDMDIADDDIVVGKDQLSDASIQPQTSILAAVQTVIGFEVKLNKGDRTENAPIYESNSVSVEESPSRGVKRARVESKEPSIRVIYTDLTRKAKESMQLMQQWSEWQTRRQHHLKEAVEGTLESGEETYYPALHVGSEKSCAVSFWVDNQAKESDTVDDDTVPLYDREFTLGSTPLGDSSNTERMVESHCKINYFLQENDPPPWLHRMRELGYPPGYLDVVDDEDKPSGITIFGDGEVKLEHEEGELSEQAEASPPKKRMTVEFPGINAPIPENGDQWLWGSAPPQSSGRYHSLDSRDYRDRGPPGADHYSSRYHSHDYGPLSPSLGRSHSDRGWRSPPRYDNLPADDGSCTPHSYPSRQYSGHYSSSSEMSSRHSRDRDRDRHDSRHYHHRR
ncbi:unnamed protein product [Miscanthus lutarioriparius]|uniref:PSP proline-rich domain-containing protein n=1 Tax=Miscanthus lutarioriparius TaxID=422564 RepID=A0A811SHJ6_9POAL|nr:unnamed protein product [Miscanthus lutarioriparius]